MQNLSYNTSVAIYLMFGNGLLMLSVAFMLHTFAAEIKSKLRLWPFFGAALFAAISRVLTVFGVLTGSEAVLDAALALVFVYFMFFVEYAHQCFSGDVFSKKSLKLHIPVAIPVAIVIYYSKYYDAARYILTTFALLTVIVAVLAGCRLACRVLSKNLRKYLVACFLLTLVMGLSQSVGRVELRYDQFAILAQNEQFVAFSILEIVFIFIMAFCISTANLIYSRHKRPRLIDYQGVAAPILVPAVIILIASLAAVNGFYFEKNVKAENRVIVEERAEEVLCAVNMLLNISTKFVKALAELPLFQNFITGGKGFNYAGTNDLLLAFARINPNYSCALIDSAGQVKLASKGADKFFSYAGEFKKHIGSALIGKSDKQIFFDRVDGEIALFICSVVFNKAYKPVGMVVVKSEINDLINTLKLKTGSNAVITDAGNKILLSPDQDQIGCVISTDQLGMHILSGTQAVKQHFYESSYLHCIKKLAYENWQIAVVLPWSQALPKEQFHIMLAITFVSLGVLLFFYAASTQKDRFEAYEELQERFRAIFNNAPESILVISSDNLEILEANNSTIRQFEITDGVVGKNYKDLLAKSVSGISNVHFQKDTQFFKHHRDFVKANGEVFTADVMGAPIIFADKRAIMLLLRDITKLKQAGVELMKAKETAEAADTIKSRFFANASHEIRTPMNAIIGLSEFAYDLSENPDQRRILGLLRSSSQSLLRLINNILDLSAIESGKLDVKTEPTRIKELIAELILLTKGTLGNKQLEITSEIAPNVPDVILTDSVKLRQIMLNLLGNAAKHTDTGFVKLCASIVKQEGKTLLECQVEDTGPGITPELRESIFMPFIHGSYQGRSGVNGTGLGLSICQQLVDLLGGSIQLDSTGPGGSVFSFRIPVEVPQELAGSSPDGAAAKAAKRPDNAEAALGEEMAGFALVKPDKTPLNVLVADDNEVNLFLAGSLVEKFKGSFSCAYNGREVLELYGSANFDLALIDIQMPVMDGVSAIKEIRKQEKLSTRHLPIIAISAFASGVERDTAIEAGADKYLAKPYFPKDLLNLIKETLGEEVCSEEQQNNGQQAAKAKVKINLLQVDEKELQLRILDKANNLAKIAEIYSRRSKELIEKLTDAKNGAELAGYAHSCKGLVGMLGAKNSFELALKVEQLAKEDKFGEAYFFVPELIRHIHEIESDLKQLLAAM